MSLRSDLQVVSGLAVAELAPVWDVDRTDLADALIQTLPVVVERYATIAGTVAADTYEADREAAEVRGRFNTIVAPLRDFGTESLAWWGLTKGTTLDASRTLIEGGVQKRIVNAANETFTENVSRDPAARGWQRVTRAGACRFCQMVSGRGGVYTRSTATFACHEMCHCTAVPAWGGRPVPVSKYEPSDRPASDADRARVRAWIAQNLPA